MTAENKRTFPLVDQAKVKEVVRQAYGERATRAGESSCCGPTGRAGIPDAVYNAATLEELPDSVVNAAAGCGNPTAIAGLQQGERVLDLGSGGGIDCFLAARQVGQTGHITGLDMTEEMITLARANAERLGASNVAFVQGELEDIPLPDQCVDVIISNCVINLSPDKDSVFREAFRVLAPGGRMHLSDVLADGELPEEIRSNPENWKGCVGGADPIETYLARIRNAGFVDARIVSRSQYRRDLPDLDMLVSAQVEARKP